MGDQKDNVKVIIRVRPLNEREKQEGAKISVSIPEPYKTVAIDVKSEQKCFTYDYVASEDITQEEIFEQVGKPIALSCLTGYNGTIFAYGQTGAGKTFTILGTSIENSSDFFNSSEYLKRGLLPRCFEYLFTSIQNEMQNNSIEYLIKCSYLEIYQEQVNDLLDPNPQNLQLREDLKRGVYVEGLIEESVNNIYDTYELLRIGTLNRHVGSTSMNKESSRSHSVFTLVIESKKNKDGINNFITSRFHLIDLAGSERQKATDCAGERLKEAGMINKSLSALGNVINSLVDISEGKSRHIHYRDSKLTFLLKDSLGGNSKTCIIANISPAFSASNETLSTLKFAQRAKEIKNAAIINEEASGAMLMLKYEIKRLKEELLLARGNTGPCKGQTFYNEEQGVDKNIFEVLQQTLRLKQEENNMFNKQIEEKDNSITVLRSSLRKLENKINHDKMVLKFRDATILRLQNNTPDESKEVLELKQEIESLMEQIESNPNLAKLFVENQKLKAEIEANKIEENGGLDSFKGRIAELEEISYKLAEALKVTVSEKQELEAKYSEKEDNFNRMLEEETELVKEKNNKLIMENQSLENQIIEIEKIIQGNSNKIDKKLEESYINRIAELTNDIKAQQENLEKLNKGYEYEINEVNKENTCLKEKMQKLKESLVKVENNENTAITESQRKLIVLSKELSNLKAAYQDKENELDISNFEINNITETNKGLNIHIIQLQNKYNQLEDKNSDLERRLSALNNQLKVQETSLESFKKASENLANYQQLYNNLLDENEKCKQDLHFSKENLSKYQYSYNNLLEENKKYEEEVKISKDDIAILQEKLHFLNENNKKLVEEIEKTNEYFKENSEKMQSYQEDGKKFLKLETELKLKINELAIEKDNLNSRLIKSIKHEEELESCVENLQLEYSKYKQDRDLKLSEAKKEIKYLEQEINQSKDNNLLVKDLEAKIISLQEEVKITKISLENFQELNLSITQKNAELSTSLGKMHSSHVPIYIVDQLRHELSDAQGEISTLKEENRKKAEILKITKTSINSTKNEIAT